MIETIFCRRRKLSRSNWRGVELIDLAYSDSGAGEGLGLRYRGFRGASHDGADPVAQALRAGNLGSRITQGSQGIFTYLLRWKKLKDTNLTGNISFVIRTLRVQVSRFDDNSGKNLDVSRFSWLNTIIEELYCRKI